MVFFVFVLVPGLSKDFARIYLLLFHNLVDELAGRQAVNIKCPIWSNDSFPFAGGDEVRNVDFLPLCVEAGFEEIHLHNL